MFRHWVEFHYYDFEREPKLLMMLEEFVGSIRSRSMQKWVTSIHRALKKVCLQGCMGIWSTGYPLPSLRGGGKIESVSLIIISIRKVKPNSTWQTNVCGMLTHSFFLSHMRALTHT